MIPLVGFLPPSDERVAATVELAVISTFGLLARLSQFLTRNSRK
jgi:hypothetical protein